MRLFIAEKPSLARTIAEYLGIVKRAGGYIVCRNDDVVTWCFGHLLEMAQPERYNKSWGNRYNKQILPIVPEHILLEPKTDQGASSQLSVITDLLKKCSQVVNAGDPDREGQLLVDEVLDYLHYDGPTDRIFLASLDAKSVTRALGTMRENVEYRSWRDAAETRRTIDWLGGINMSRAMTIFGHSLGFQGVLSLGRVQTPTLRIVVERDRQIAHFVPVDYAQLTAEIAHEKGSFLATFKPGDATEGCDPEGRLTNFEVAGALQKESAPLPGLITGFERKNGKEWPKLPYSLASLQVDCAAKFGFSAQQVLNIAQRLYEGKFTTYPRTDCEYLPEEQFGDAPEIIRMLSGHEFLKEACAGADTSLRGKAWDTKKITAHHAIIPTGVRPSSLSFDEERVYLRIALRYVLQFWPPQEFMQSKISVRLENGTEWEARGKVIKKAGWTAVLKNEQKEEDEGEEKEKDGEGQTLPAVRKGDPVKSVRVDLKKKRTTPPAHFTEGTLINAMKNIHRFVDDKNARTKLRETSGLGTEATRAGILETLKKRGYLEGKGKKLLSTSKGQSIIDLCPASMKDIVTTAVLEDILSDVQAGTVEASEAVKTYVRKLPPMIEAVFTQDVSKITCPEFDPCPLCKRAVRRIRGKKSGKYFWICTNEDCKAFFTDEDGKIGTRIVQAEISRTHTCPECGKPLARRQRKDGSGFFWSCTGYPDCRFACPDIEGKPGPRREVIQPPVPGTFFCPHCGSPLRYGRSKTGRFYWACFNRESGKHSGPVFFDCQKDGSPRIPETLNERNPERKPRN
ncbi:MAG: DNA topoisomerase 3 [Desulfovibrio sp.]|nr:DNA topoisomerase 3 [Desulfovibrio sp.]